ncbi:MAG: nucleotide exchange factor GrpE [Anaerotardibacter sp.]
MAAEEKVQENTAQASQEACEVEAEVLDPETAEEASEETEEAVAEETAEEQIEAAKRLAADWQDKYLRLHAEWDTYRRRMNEQREEEKLRAGEKVIENLIPVMDDFERTISYAETNGENGLLDGVKAVYNKLGSVFEKEGVEVINPKGEALNPLEAQAVATVPDATVPDETVAEVYQKGYRMGTKVIRTAMVTVTTGGPRREVETEE